ncbi:MAG TPA: polyprenyl diphosphate synthase [archaeon]|nr:polyprenyl diphosphate synthase [archaeon]
MLKTNKLQVPNHIAFVLDGNRRWAQKHRLNLFGHRQGGKRFEEVMNWCLELGVPHISAYVLSTENLERPKDELQEIFSIMSDFLKKFEKKQSVFEKYEVKVRFVGNLNKLPPELVKLMGKIMQKTAKYQQKALNILVAYGSKFELTEVMKKIAEKAIKAGKIEITQKDIEQNLLVPIPVDLVIRTGGMSRLSNFLLWQAAYAEIYFTKTLWPDFSKKELIKAIEWYNSARKNFGK